MGNRGEPVANGGRLDFALRPAREFDPVTRDFEARVLHDVQARAPGQRLDTTDGIPADGPVGKPDDRGASLCIGGNGFIHLKRPARALAGLEPDLTDGAPPTPACPPPEV